MPAVASPEKLRDVRDVRQPFGGEAGVTSAQTTWTANNCYTNYTVKVLDATASDIVLLYTLIQNVLFLEKV